MISVDFSIPIGEHVFCVTIKDPTMVLAQDSLLEELCIGLIAQINKVVNVVQIRPEAVVRLGHSSTMYEVPTSVINVVEFEVLKLYREHARLY